ncbi:universal stress protein [Amycolatopsis pithecellobii]|uniref:Universal stress protein n=1 Tax=Amycolatopsis pithecellobii TaxID=664692 RepID=A0A6N7ZD55_9PSEU|nr:universal stress protein [Amycolatopsis pithecellobii]MTD59609.1 universal stress protein [Amycolatopsis pithecellobii]
MVDTSARHSILVGIDGSGSALHAARWAAREGRQRRMPVRLFHACAVPPGAAAATETLVEQGHQWLRLAKDEVSAEVPDVDVHTDLRVGPAAREIVDESAKSRLVVLGSRGLGGFQEMLLGSVSVAVARHGHCPVVVVRGRMPDDPPPATGPIVVGVDGSPVSDAAVEFAFEEAGFRNVPLVAVHTWLDVSVEETWAALPSDVDWDAVAEDESRVLAERLAGLSEKYPEVEVRRRVMRDRPVRGLLSEADGAQLIVIGSRGRGGFAGMGLGSTSQTLLHHSPCPVIVVRTPDF